MMLLFVPFSLALTLDEAVRLAETQSDDARLIDRQEDAATTVRGQAASALLPRVSLSGSYTINQYESTLDFSKMIPEELAGLMGESEPVVINKKEFWSGSATVVQPLLSGAAIPAWYAAQATARAAEAQADVSRDQLAVGVARTYWGAWLARERIRLAEDTVTRAEKHAALAATREEVGSGRAIDTAQAGVALARARRELATAQAGRVEAEEALARLLGVEVGIALERPTLAVLDLDERTALERVGASPSLQLVEERARAARQARLATDLGWAPSISGRFTESFSENSGFSGEEWNWQAAITADWPLFDGGLRIAKQREAAANAQLAAIAADRERDQAGADVRTAYANLAAAREANVLAGQERALAERALALSEASYAAGAMTFLDLWQTRQQRDGAELAVLGAEMQLDLSTRALLAKLGR